MNIGDAEIAKLAEAIGNAARVEDTEQRSLAEVVGKDEYGRMVVRLNGSDKETPVSSATAECSPGDTVSVVFSNDRLTIDGNITSPSVGGSYVASEVAPVAETAQQAYDGIKTSMEAADVARAAASAASASAENAQSSANKAVRDAQIANENALAAQASAGVAQDSANKAQQSADQAISDADAASTAAQAAQKDASAANTAAKSAQSDATAAKTDAAAAKTAATNAQSDATAAKTAAESAKSDAASAKTDAASAKSDAATAKTQATAATTAANEAKTQAGNATTAANEAKTQASEANTAAKVAQAMAYSAEASLSDVEKVLDTLTWISEHGTYVKTADTEVDPRKVYYQQVGENLLVGTRDFKDGQKKVVGIYTSDGYVTENTASVPCDFTYYNDGQFNELTISRTGAPSSMSGTARTTNLSSDDFAAGDVYTLSFEYRLNSNVEFSGGRGIAWLGRFNATGPISDRTEFGMPTGIQTDVWHRATVTYKASAAKTDSTFIGVTLAIRVNGSVSFRKVAIYRGNIADPIWSPSPYDYNLLKGTKDWKKATGKTNVSSPGSTDGFIFYEKANSTWSLAKNGQFEELTIKHSGATAAVYNELRNQAGVSFKSGDVFTMSFEYRVNSDIALDNTAIALLAERKASADVGAKYFYVSSSVAKDVWHKAVITSTMTDDSSSANCDVNVSVRLTQNGSVSFRKVALYRGNIADPSWTPALSETGYGYLPVENPTKAGLVNYYELDIDSGVSNYVNMHLALKDDGLHVIGSEAYDYEVVLNNDGMDVLNPSRLTAAHYGEKAQFYDGLGFDDSHITAEFGKDGFRVGKQDNAYVQGTATDITLKGKNGYSTVLNSSGMDVKNASGTSVANYGSTTRIGPANAQNVTIESAAVKINDGTTAEAQFTASAITLGKTNTRNTVIDTNGLTVKDSSTQLANFGASSATIGKTSTKHAIVDSNGLTVKDSTTQLAQFGANSATIGNTEYGHVVIDSQGLTAKFDNEQLANFGKDGSTIGRTDGRHVLIRPSFFEIAESNFRVGKYLEPNGYVPVGDIYTVDSTLNRIYYIDHKPESLMGYAGTTIGGLNVYVYDTSLKRTKLTQGSDYTISYQTTGSGRRVQIGISSRITLQDGYTVSIEYWTDDVPDAMMFGDGSVGSGLYSFATGKEATAAGDYSFAQGTGTYAAGVNQVAIGRYNDFDFSDEYALIIGNGNEDNRSNALTVAWDGTITAAKPFPIASGGTGDTGIVKNTSGVFSEASGVTLSSQQCFKWGKVAMVRFDVKVNSAISVPANGRLSSPITLGNVESRYRPTITSFFGTSYHQSTGMPTFYIRSDGDVVLTGFESTGAARTVAAGSSLMLTSTYLAE